jgi:hypothetical protein
MTYRQTEWRQFLAENVTGSAEYRGAREAALKRFQGRRLAEEQRRVTTESAEKETRR